MSAMRYPAEGEFFQLGYVTWDLERAMSAFRLRYGIADFYRLDTRGRLPAPLSTPPLQSALAYRGPVLIEIAQPNRDAPGLYSDALRDDGGVNLHHLGYLVDSARIATLADEFRAQGIPVPVQRENPEGVSVMYADTRREAGLFSEYVSICPDAVTIFDSIPRS